MRALLPDPVISAPAGTPRKGNGESDASDMFIYEIGRIDPGKSAIQRLTYGTYMCGLRKSEF